MGLNPVIDKLGRRLRLAVIGGGTGSFIGAMHDISSAVALPLIREINPGGLRCVLDVGGGPGTWTMAWLQVEPAARAILFDLPAVIPLARERLTRCGVAGRVTLAAGDFLIGSEKRLEKFE